MNPPASVGASVGELLDQAEEVLYGIATRTPSANRLFDACPAYLAACARLTAAAVGPRFSGHAAVARHPNTDPVLVAGLRLAAHIEVTSLTTRLAVPDPALIRAATLIGAAADLIECAHDRPGVRQRDIVQAGGSRSAGVIRAAELTLTGVDLTIQACGRAHQQAPTTAPNTPARLTARATALFTTRRLAANVLDAAAGRPRQYQLDDVRVPTVGAAGADDLLGRLRSALANWRTLNLESAESPAVSSAELQRATVEARHVIALTAALTDAGRTSGLIPAGTASITMAQLQRAGGAWSAATTAWTQFTTGVQPGDGHVRASLDLQSAVRAITRDGQGDWLDPAALDKRVDVRAALEAVRASVGDVIDVGRAHADAVNRVVGLGNLYALATALPLEEDRLAARLHRRHVPVTTVEALAIRDPYRQAVATTTAAHREVAAVAVQEPAERGRSRSRTLDPTTAAGV